MFLLGQKLLPHNSGIHNSPGLTPEPLQHQPTPLTIPSPLPYGSPVPSFLGYRHNDTSIKELSAFYYIGGRLQTPELQVGQLISEDLIAPEPGLLNREIIRFMFSAPHLGQVNLEPSLPMD